jgi:hypothetical protein
MDPGKLSVQRNLSASCVECGERSHFRMCDSDTAARVAVFACRRCDNEITVDLAPEVSDSD